MLQQSHQRTPLIWMTLISTVILFTASSLRHFLFQSNALDLAAFDQWIYLTSQGLPPISSFFGFHMVGDHAAFILYLIAPLYKINSHVNWLFLIQSMALSLGCLPIYNLSLQTGLSVNYGRALAICYLLYPALFNINLFSDFRPEVIAVPPLLWAIWAGIEKKTWQLITCITLVLGCKDILSLTVIALGLWFLLVINRYIYGLGCITIGGLWYTFTIGYLVPLLRGSQAGGVGFFSSLGNTPAEIIWNIIGNPYLIIYRFFLPDRVFYYFLLIVPVIIGLHWRSISTILPALPMLLLNILSDYWAQRDITNHYSLAIFPFIILWLIYSLYQYQQNKRRIWLKPRLLIIYSTIVFLLLARYEFFITRYFTSISHLTSLHTAVSLVKTSESVLTTSKIAPHLSQRQMIKLVPDNWTSSAESDINFKYVLIDLLNSQKKPALKRLVNQIKNDSEFNLTYAKDQVYLFTRMH